jgi:hypothetical protein
VEGDFTPENVKMTGEEKEEKEESGGRCICGHKIKNICYIQHVNDKKVFQVGNCCVRKISEDLFKANKYYINLHKAIDKKKELILELKEDRKLLKDDMKVLKDDRKAWEEDRKVWEEDRKLWEEERNKEKKGRKAYRDIISTFNIIHTEVNILKDKLKKLKKIENKYNDKQMIRRIGEYVNMKFIDLPEKHIDLCVRGLINGEVSFDEEPFYKMYLEKIIKEQYEIEE